MKTTEANRMNPRYELRDDLARLCLPAAQRDPDRMLAWVNSICLLFLLIGLLGARRTAIDIPPVPPLLQVIPVIVEPAILRPQPTAEKRPQEQANPDATPV